MEEEDSQHDTNIKQESYPTEPKHIQKPLLQSILNTAVLVLI